MNFHRLLLFAIGVVFLFGCHQFPDENVVNVSTLPVIYPDYSALIIPVNIAPLNFMVEETGNDYYVTISNSKGTSFGVWGDNRGKIHFPRRKWKQLLENSTGDSLFISVAVQKNGEWQRFKTFSNYVANEKIPPFLYYRLLYPGYESWSEISIMKRDLQNFDDETVVNNNVVGQNCVNCHSFNFQHKEDFMFHMRGSLGGTYFLSGDKLKKVNLKTSEMQNGAVYPRWHPSGRYVAFSSNKVVQQFHAMEEKKIEVSDLNSSLMLFDLEKNEIVPVPVDTMKEHMDTYPEWSPDGKFMYFCRAAQIGESYNYEDIKYDLWRVSFDPESRKFGRAEMVFDANALHKSVSFPRISPQGNLLVFTLHNYGCFPIWHKEADLYALNLKNLSCNALEVNSDFTESYHSWAGSGRWLVFSSKKDDGLSARPYIAYINENGHAGKPFVLPQLDPGFYRNFLKTYNIPEFAETDVTFSPGEIRKAAEKEAVQVKWASK